MNKPKPKAQAKAAKPKLKPVAKPASKPKLKASAKAAPPPSAKSAPTLKSAAAAKSKPVPNKTIMESAQHIWLAGLGAFAKAQEEGGKLFEALVKEGSTLEQKTRKIATGTVGDVRGAVESSVSQVRERTQETWDKLEQVFETRVSRALGKLNVPGRKDLDDLLKRVDELGQQVRKLTGNARASIGQVLGEHDHVLNPTVIGDCNHTRAIGRCGGQIGRWLRPRSRPRTEVLLNRRARLSRGDLADDNNRGQVRSERVSVILFDLVEVQRPYRLRSWHPQAGIVLGEHCLAKRALR